ncbi:hypothetical protein S245_036694, partial [Arachis hypogaea]
WIHFKMGIVHDLDYFYEANENLDEVVAVAKDLQTEFRVANRRRLGMLLRKLFRARLRDFVESHPG